uniref:NCK adaptor protein 1 n=1 Tax=Microcebus murinus TaxID=30608 RepID=A0A8C5XBA1_MICMU
QGWQRVPKDQEDDIKNVKRKPSVPDSASPADDSFVDPGERLYDLNMPAYVKFNYMAEREDELSLIKGTKVIVMEKCSDGWWRGSYNGQVGWFPSNYVTEEGDSPLGDHVGSLSEKLAAVVNNLNTGQVLHVVQALYPFSSSNDEELNFEKGDVMDVIEKPENDPEWWKCRKINGMVGLVPKNYVTIMQNNPLTSSMEPSPPQCDYIRPSLTGKFAGNPWYYGKVTRHQAEMALNERGHEGDFLIRDSESSDRVVHLLSLTSHLPCSEEAGIVPIYLNSGYQESSIRLPLSVYSPLLLSTHFSSFFHPFAHYTFTLYTYISTKSHINYRFDK